MTNKTKLALSATALAAAVGSVVLLSPAPPAAPVGFQFTSIKKQGGNIVLTWTGGGSTNQLQSKSDVMGAWSNVGAPTTASSATNPITGPIAFYRLVIATNGLSATWANRFGGTATDYGLALAADSTGNILATGIFSGVADFGGVTLTSAGGYDVFVAKYSASGTVIWARRYGSATNSEVAKCLAMDASGNIFIGGILVGGSLMKLDASGNQLWVRGPSTGFPNTVNFASIATDSLGNVVVTGDFTCPAPLDFGNGIILPNIFGGTVNGGTDAFMVQYSPSGFCLWGKGFANSGDTEFGNDVAVDHSDNIFLTGYAFSGVNIGGADFGNGNYGAYGFLGKYNSAGVHLWSRRVGTKKATDPTSAFSRARVLGLDSNGNVFISGELGNRSNMAGEPMDSGDAYLFSTSPAYNLYMSKYSGSSGAYQWAKALIGSKDEKPIGLSVGQSDNVFLTGQFRGTSHFDGTTNSNAFQLTTTGPDQNQYDVFVAKYSTAGVPQWAKNFGGANGDAGNAIVTTGGNVVASGYFQDTASFNGQTLTSAGSLDGFIASLPQ